MKQLYMAHTEFNDYIIAVKATNADEAERLANEWFSDNVTSIDTPDINWIIDLCDNDEIIE